MAQVAREKALTKFREDKIRVLVATDVAARGIDVQGVSHVINYTCPEDEKTYVHRIGRTGRAGATGIAITFVDWADLHRWKMINKALDLPFEEPQETYSTSEHLFHDQGIPPGTKGRIVDPAPVEPRPRRASGPRGAATVRRRASGVPRPQPQPPRGGAAGRRPSVASTRRRRSASAAAGCAGEGHRPLADRPASVRPAAATGAASSARRPVDARSAAASRRRPGRSER